MIFKKILFSSAFIFIGLLAFAQTYGYYKEQIVFDPVISGYYVFRIPSIVTTQKGNILVFAEGRKGKGGDWDPSNIVYRASYDSGTTWTPLAVLADNGNTTCSNAVPILDFFNDKVHLLYTVGYKNVYYRCSIDEGVSWDEPIDITDVFEVFKEKYPWKVIVTGPGHGTQLSTGRILVPIWLSESAGVDSATNTLTHYPSVTSLMKF